MSLRQAAQQALEAWFRPHGINYVDFKPYMEALRAALAEPEQNPFDAERYARKLHEWREFDKALFAEHKPQTTHWEGCEAVHPECRKPDPVAAWENKYEMKEWHVHAIRAGWMPAPTPRKPLSEDEIVDIWAGVSMDYDDEINIIELARAIERHHGIGDSDAT